MTKKNQIARNERERKRVNLVNAGFDDLRIRLQPKNQNKKLSKADTLREAVKYIQKLQQLLNQDPQQPSVSSTSPDYSMNANNFTNFAGKEEYPMYLPQNYHQVPSHQISSLPNADNSFNSPTSSVSSSSYSPTQMSFYHPSVYANYHHQ